MACMATELGVLQHCIATLQHQAGFEGEGCGSWILKIIDTHANKMWSLRSAEDMLPTVTDFFASNVSGSLLASNILARLHKLVS